MHAARLFPVLLFLVFLPGCSAPLQRNVVENDPSIRVCIAERSREVVIGLEGGAVLETVNKRYSLEGYRELRCLLQEDGSMHILMDGKAARRFRGAFRCYYRTADGLFTLDRGRYGDTLLLATDGRTLFVVNVLPLESYLRGVVPNEIGRNRKRAEMEAVKAQAILARTYAMGKMLLPLKRLFDVYADVRDQVYNGRDSHDVLTGEAVEQTRGTVLAWEGRLAEVYFHSTCGGKTEASSLVWKRPQSKPYLTGIVDRAEADAWCRVSPSYRWTEQYGRKQLEHMLRTFLPAANDAILPEDIPPEHWHLLDLNIIKRMPSGRVATLQVVMGNRARQRAYYVHGDRIRRVLRRADDGQPLRSTLFDIHIERDVNRWISGVRIDGGGTGHGVGFCQWGAISRARSGQQCTAILTAYFPGTHLMRLY
ncbi:MAG: SpoIID/LytB domain-containing protein [Bacteroidetes bacterium]|nr:SpoIID/LytB domain-containing protein [Bacteroidota bacterium]